MPVKRLYYQSGNCSNKVTKPLLMMILTVLMLACQMLRAEVVLMRIEGRELLEDGRVFGKSGQYEKLTGKLYLEVDPNETANQRITDLRLAERNKRGKVEFWTEFELLKPVDSYRSNRRLLYLVNNRGNKISLPFLHSVGGKDWLFRQGYSILWCGWNGDVIWRENRLNISLPVARKNGKTITSRIYAEICVMRKQFSQPFYWGGSDPYPSVSLDNSTASLTMRPDRKTEAVEVPLDQWAFARWKNGQAIPDPRHLYIKKGFRPGWLYELIYIGKDPKVTGLGFAAVRDVASFFRYATTDHRNNANPLAQQIERAYIFGISQSARFIYHFIYEDFNHDVNNRLIFDGAMPHVGGGGKGQFNYRFAQTTRHGSHHEDNLYPSDFFPFNTVEQIDPITGRRGNVLGKARKSGFLPKIFLTGTSTEYWTRAASLIHTDVEGNLDAGLDPSVRLYYFTGRTHVDARSGPLLRALLVALDEWASYGIEPPASCYPRISNGTLVELETFRKSFPAIPGVKIPESFFMPLRLDPGPRWETEGIADNIPPKIGKAYSCLVPAVDSNGNELAGIRLPSIAVPLGTYTGWCLRGPDKPAAGTLERWAGSRWPFSMTIEERKSKGDPRPSIEELYPTHTDYLSKVVSVVLKLKSERFLLDEDAVYLLQEAAHRDFTVPIKCD